MDADPTLSPRSTLLLVVALLAGSTLAGCTQPSPGTPTDGSTPPDGDTRDGEPAPPVPTANETRLMELVQRQTHPNGTDGPVRYRTPGTVGHASTIPDLEEMLRAANATTTRERFTAELPRLGVVNLTNVYGVRQGTDPGDGEIWLAAHWDSRAWADAHREPCTGPPVQGANDGAAGVAVVVHALERLPSTEHPIRVALFDGEDQGCRTSDLATGYGDTAWAVGSTHAARVRADRGELDEVRALVLVDMPGAEDLVVRREGRSAEQAPRLTNLAFSTSERLGAGAFRNETGPGILDDHAAFLDRGVAAVDLIHLDEDDRRGPFPWTHHTEHDTVENLDPANMAQVTRVVMGTVLAIDEGALDRGS